MTAPSRLAELIVEQESLLRDLGFGVRAPDEADDEYRRRHQEIGPLLRAQGVPCYCPWGSAHAFPGWAAKKGDVEAALALLLTDDVKRVAGIGPEQPTWTLVSHPRFVRDFVQKLGRNKQEFLDTMLREELAVRGMELRLQTDKLKPCTCDGGGSVLEYRIQRTVKNTDYKLRVFVETRPGNVLRLLHGFDKSADDNENAQNAAVQEACRRQGE